MGNHSIPVVDKDNITDEERKRLLNRAKCRLRRQRHKEKNLAYQRKYKAEHADAPSHIYQVIKQKIRRRIATIERHTANPTKRSALIIRDARAGIAECEQQLIELNYQPLNKHIL